MHPDYRGDAEQVNEAVGIVGRIRHTARGAHQRHQETAACHHGQRCPPALDDRVGRHHEREQHRKLVIVASEEPVKREDCHRTCGSGQDDRFRARRDQKERPRDDERRRHHSRDERRPQIGRNPGHGHRRDEYR